MSSLSVAEAAAELVVARSGPTLKSTLMRATPSRSVAATGAGIGVASSSTVQYEKNAVPVAVTLVSNVWVPPGLSGATVAGSGGTAHPDHVFCVSVFAVGL